MSQQTGPIDAVSAYSNFSLHVAHPGLLSSSLYNSASQLQFPLALLLGILS